MGRYHVLLAFHGLSGYELAFLEHNCRVSEDEVNGACDDGVTVELPVGVGVECVLKGIYPATVYDGFVGPDTECNCLVLLWACRVLEPDVLSYKSITNSSCIANIWRLMFRKQLLPKPILKNEMVRFKPCTNDNNSNMLKEGNNIQLMNPDNKRNRSKTRKDHV